MLSKPKMFVCMFGVLLGISAASLTAVFVLSPANEVCPPDQMSCLKPGESVFFVGVFVLLPAFVLLSLASLVTILVMRTKRRVAVLGFIVSIAVLGAIGTAFLLLG
jgi:hypothetical protein